LDENEWRLEEEENEEGKAIVEKVQTGEKFNVRTEFAQRYLSPGQVQRMSGGERGCAHSHYRIWKHVADQNVPVLVLEDDVELRFERSDPKFGQANGHVFTERLDAAMKHLPEDYDVLYLGWSGYRGGNFKRWDADSEGLSEDAKRYVRKAEYVWTTVAYVLTPTGAKKLLEAAQPLNQPVDNFMGWEAAEGRLNSFVAVDDGDADDLWAGGLVDQFDFQGDSDIVKSDGGVQGDNAQDFAVEKISEEVEVEDKSMPAAAAAVEEDESMPAAAAAAVVEDESMEPAAEAQESTAANVAEEEEEEEEPAEAVAAEEEEVAEDAAVAEGEPETVEAKKDMDVDVEPTEHFSC